MKSIVRVLPVVVVLLALGTVVAQDQRSYSAGRQLLELDKAQMGLLRGASGGEIFSEVVVDLPGTDWISRKQLSNPTYAPIHLQCGFDMEPALYGWISKSWTATVERKSGSIHQLTFNLNGVTQRQFFNALVTETTIPACDANSRDAGVLNVKLAPEYTRDSISETRPANAQLKRNRVWNMANYRLTIGGLDCTRVNKIDSFTVKRTAPSGKIGDERDTLGEPGKLEFPNLKITMSEISSQTWKDWYLDFLVAGNNGSDREKTGTLEFLSPNRQTVLATVNFFGLGIFKLGPDVADAKSCDCDVCGTVVAGANNADNIRRVTAHLYCERMEFVFQPPPVGD